MIRVLVTGGLGFIGSHIVDALCEKEGYDVYVIDKKSKQEVDYTNSNARYRRCDITNFIDLRQVFSLSSPQYVIHCAAEARIQPSFDDPELYRRVNVSGTENILKLSKAYKVKRVVYSASSSAYGLQSKMPLKENMRPQPTSPYAETKLGGERLCGEFTAKHGLETVSLRYFNVYGPRQPSEGRYATVIGIFLRQLKNKEPLTLVGDGKQTRDFTHVSDVVRANILAMFSDNVGGGEVINIGTGKNYSICDVADIVGGGSYHRVFIPKRLGEAQNSCADNTKAKVLLGWKPTITLKEGAGSMKEEMNL